MKVFTTCVVSRSVDLLIWKNPHPALFNGHPNWFILTSGKEPRHFLRKFEDVCKWKLSGS